MPTVQTAALPDHAFSRTEHVVQFYESDEFLCDSVSRFMAAGLRNGHPLIIIATSAHQDSFRKLLADEFDLDQFTRTGQLTLIDAHQCLSTFMDGNAPNAERFRRIVGGLVEKSRAGREHMVLQAFGEMVDILWRGGNSEGAISLEALWNDLGMIYPFNLLCAYTMDNFPRVEHHEQFLDVCGRHDHVLPSERYSQAPGSEARLREISALEQRARALESEIENRKRLEQALIEALQARQRAQVEAENANRVKDEFLAILSHELRTPLNAILGWTHIIGTNPDQPTMQRAFEVIQRNAKAQLHLVEDLLDVSRIVTGKMTINCVRVDLVALLEAAVDSVRPAALAKAIELDLQTDQAARFMTGDPDRLQQVVWNLLTNAIKFTPGGGRVEIWLRPSMSHVEILIRDSGQGIAAEFLPHVFDRFRQADGGSTRRHGGLGLGLAVVRHLVEAHGGTVSASSDGPGLGSTFSVTLPAQSNSRGSTTEKAADPVSPALKNCRILVIDDQKDTRELFTYVLNRAGATVTAAGSVDEAMRTMSMNSFDVLLCDVGTPDSDGFALIASIRNHPRSHVRGISAIAVTPYADDESRANALNAGFDNCISKPIPPDQLVEVIVSRLAVNPDR